MRLTLLNEYMRTRKPTPDELFASAISNAKASDEELISFYQLPIVVQHAVLADMAYEDIQDVYSLPPIFIVRRKKDWVEFAYNQDGTAVQHPEVESDYDPDTLDWQMEQQYGKPEDYGL